MKTIKTSKKQNGFFDLGFSLLVLLASGGVAFYSAGIETLTEDKQMESTENPTAESIEVAYIDPDCTGDDHEE